jgi:hypothetical protein
MNTLIIPAGRASLRVRRRFASIDIGEKKRRFRRD